MRAHQPTSSVKPALLAILLAFPAQQALAANCTWNPATGNWSTASDWSCGIVPTGGLDTAIIAGGKVVTVNTAQSILNLTNSGGVNIDAFLLTLAGGGSTTNTGTINVGAGPNPNNAALQVAASHNINNAGGVINISADSVLNQFGSTITGGTINTTGSGALVAFNNGNNFLSGAALNGRLDLASNTGIERIVNGLTLGGPGVVNINSASLLTFEGTQNVAGTGTLNFGSAAGNRIQLEGAGTTTLAAGVVIRGQNGTIGSGQSFIGGANTLVNNGTISADVAGGQITLASAGGGGVTNNNLLEARNGATLNIQSVGVSQGALGQISALNGSTVLLNASSITGGTLGTSGTGKLVATNNGNNFLNGVTLDGLLDIASSTGIERITAGGMTLNGTINIGNNSILAPQGNQTIGGTGSIVFADANASNRLNVEAGNLVIGSSVTVRGQTGFIGAQSFVGGAATLTNNGTIQADVAGGAITVGVSGLTTNNGTLAALNGGTLNLNSAVAGNVGSQILAGVGSVVAQNGVTVSGTVNAVGSGSFRPSNSGNNFLDTVNFSGTLDLASATGIERVVNGLTFNAATINIGNNSILAPQGNQTLGGTGTIVFADNNASNRLNVEAGNLVVGSGITVRGQTGFIGAQSFVGGAATLTNNGTIQADVAGGAITVGVSGLTTNNGTLAALNGGTLNLNSAITGNTGSQILAGAGSVVAQNGVTISGDMNLTGPGSFRASNSGNNFLSGVTLAGTLDLASATGIERVAGGLTLNGASINIGNNSIFAPQGNQTIGGSGTIVFADSNASNRLNVEAGNLTLAAGITVRGGNGAIGPQSFVGGAATLTNQGLISADIAGRSIAVGVSGQVINQATMEARNGGQLTLNAGGGYDNTTGTLLADVGSTVLFNGASLTGGALNGSGKFVASNSSNNFLNAVTLNGVLDMASATGIERVSAGGMTLNGTINIGNNSILAPQGNQTIGGTGSIVFADGSGANRLNVEAGNLVIGPGMTVRGQNGTIGQQAFVGGAATLTNNGTINADGGGTIFVNISGALTNNGTMRAQNGTLTIQNALTGTGTLQVDSNGVMNLANTPNSQGKLVMGAAGSTLNIGTQNLTINTDYTSVVAGSGNAFNRRAGVSGAGQILAGGNAAQAITGVDVTNGNTANATLTISNVRVGATTFNYQIANTGTTGPSLRGAVQTSVNGGNLTDARLSGTGVTAGNYNTGAPGSNTGDQAVTFTAANAGALAPLNGQVLNLRSNFDNIADQKLNIVLAGGAAAYNAAVGQASSPVQVANQRVGGSLAKFFTVTNAAPAGSFSEDLNASFSGSSGQAGISGGNINGLLAGSSNSNTMGAQVDTSSAGAKVGTVTLAYQTAGKVNGVSNGLDPASVGSQVVSVNGNVYQLAAGAIQTASLNFGTVQVGQIVNQNLTIRNTASGATGFVEDLNASFGSSGGTGAGLITGVGSLNGILAGSNSNAGNGTMSVGVNTSAAAVVNGHIAVNYVSAGAVNGVSNNLGTLAVGSENFGVVGTIEATGNIIDQASPVINTGQPINLGNVRIGSASPSALVSVSNQATGNAQAALNATISGNAPITASGSFNLLAPGATDASSLSVGMSTASAGAIGGTATIAFVSDANNVGNCAPKCQMTLASQDVAVQGAVYRLADPKLNTTTVTLAARRGDAPPTAAISVSNQSPDIYTEGLKAGFAGAAPAGFSTSGSIVNLAAQGTDASSLQVALNTGTAGSFGGNTQVNFESTGSGTTGASDVSVGNQLVSLAGNVYEKAIAKVNTALVDFGIVHKGDVVAAKSISVSNAAPTVALNDTLQGSFINMPVGPFGGSGNVSGLAAGQTDSSSLQVSLNTANAGVFTSGAANLQFASHNPELADLDLGDAAVTLQAQVNNYANPNFLKTGGKGSLTGVGFSFVLDFGTLTEGSGVATAFLQLANDVTGPADLLDGAYALALSDFLASGFVSFANLAAGASQGGLQISLDTQTVGDFSDTIVLKALAHNGSGFSAAFDDIVLSVLATVQAGGPQVPEPGTLLLLTIALAMIVIQRRRGMLN